MNRIITYLFLFCFSTVLAQSPPATENYEDAIEGILSGKYTTSPYGYLLPLEPITTSIVLVVTLGAIGVIAVLVYWPLPRHR